MIGMEGEIEMKMPDSYADMKAEELMFSGGSERKDLCNDLIGASVGLGFCGAGMAWIGSGAAKDAEKEEVRILNDRSLTDAEKEAPLNGARRSQIAGNIVGLVGVLAITASLGCFIASEIEGHDLV